MGTPKTHSGPLGGFRVPGLGGGYMNVCFVIIHYISCLFYMLPYELHFKLERVRYVRMWRKTPSPPRGSPAASRGPQSRPVHTRQAPVRTQVSSTTLPTNRH